MGAGDHRGSAGRKAFALAVAALAIACIVAPGAEAKKKKITIVGTTSTAVPVAPGSLQLTTASCAKGLHITGGGFSISPEFNPNGTQALADDTGSKTLTQLSYPNGRGAWTSTTGAFPQPATAGVLTSFARCEHNKLGKYAATVFGPATLTPGSGTNLNLQCPPKTQVTSGGFTVDKPFSSSDSSSSRLFMLASYRTAANVWTVSGFNPTFGITPTTLTGYAICEKKERAITETQQSTPFGDNTAVAAATGCAKKHHAVGGGFAFSPMVAPGQSGSVPLAVVQESAPSGGRDWIVHGYDFPGPFVTPPGTALTAYAYCKSDSTKKKKKK